PYVQRHVRRHRPRLGARLRRRPARRRPRGGRRDRLVVPGRGPRRRHRRRPTHRTAASAAVRSGGGRPMSAPPTTGIEVVAIAGDSIEIRSAGSEPADEINPVAVQAMAEVGIDITAEQPKKLDYATAQDSDVIITMGCGDTCPVFPGKRYEDWQLTDPAGQPI